MYRNLANILIKRNQFRDALALCDKAIHILEPLLQKKP